MWKVEYDNHTGMYDDGFEQWWDVTNGNKSFRCWDEKDADWLCDTLNALYVKEITRNIP